MTRQFGSGRSYVTVAVYTVEDAYRLLKPEATELLLHGHKVRARSTRYEVFRHNRVCVTCGIEGIWMALQRPRGNRHECHRVAHTNSLPRAHFNLYSDSGRLMTQDHIIPRSKGGTNNLNNLQTMCTRCNSAKGSDLPATVLPVLGQPVLLVPGL